MTDLRQALSHEGGRIYTYKVDEVLESLEPDDVKALSAALHSDKTAYAIQQSLRGVGISISENAVKNWRFANGIS